MSRAYKKGLADTAANLGGAITDAEKLSGADLAQVLQASRKSSNPSSDAKGTKSLGTNNFFAGSPNNASLSGADVSRSLG